MYLLIKQKSLQSERDCPDGRLLPLILPVVNSTSVSHIRYLKHTILFLSCQPGSGKYIGIPDQLSPLHQKRKTDFQSFLLIPYQMFPDHHTGQDTASQKHPRCRSLPDHSCTKQQKGKHRAEKMRSYHNHQ